MRLKHPNFDLLGYMKFLFLQMKVPQDANKSESVVFRVLLLNRCQTEFEKDKAVELELAQKQKELDQAPQVSKKKHFQLDHNLLNTVIFFYFCLCYLMMCCTPLTSSPI